MITKQEERTMSETNWGNRLKDIADEVKTIGAPFVLYPKCYERLYRTHWTI